MHPGMLVHQSRYGLRGESGVRRRKGRPGMSASPPPALPLLLLLSLLPFPALPFDPSSSCVLDAYGCCSSAGYFWCGSSARCTHGYDVCEDGMLSSSSSCQYADSSGLVFDLSPLRLTTTSLDYKVASSTDPSLSYVFNFCANAVTPSACANATAGDPPAGATTVSTDPFRSASMTEKAPATGRGGARA